METLLEAAWGLLEGSWVPLEGFWRPLRRLLGGSWEALGRLLEASKRHLGPKTVIASIFKRFFEKKNRKFWGAILATFEHQKSYFLRFQEGIQDEADFEGVLASILGRFLKAWEHQK